jgi:hypothetical protein
MNQITEHTESANPVSTDTATPGRETRADRMRKPAALDVARAVAEEYGVCVRPIARRRIELDTGRVEVVPVPCGSTQAAKCPPCAEKARRLRMAQCREGWHLDAEPDLSPDDSTDEQREMVELRADFADAYQQATEAGDEDGAESIRDSVRLLDAELRRLGVRGSLPPLDPPERKRRARSTRRRQDVPDLPRRPVEPRTIGEVYAGRYRPSIFLTLTTDSYGPVHSSRVRNGRRVPCGCGEFHAPDDSVLGTPLDPDTYDYRRAARDAVHFSAVIDRFWQNLRRCVGWEVQYFAAVEPQKRQAPHLHAAIRGSIPRATLRQVAAATYHQVWWPSHDEQKYTGDRLPVWDLDRQGFVDPDTRELLTAWDDALDEIDTDSDAEPAHVVRLGAQVDIKGVLAGTQDAGRRIGYLTKYLTKTIAECHEPTGDAQRAHADRLRAELAVTPCSPRCAVWLLYGIQPKGARPSMEPGRCKGKTHRPDTLGLAGRRVLVSRKWSGKDLTDHRHDRREFVRAMLAGIGVTLDDPPPASEVVWEPVAPGDDDMPPRPVLLLHAVAERRRWRAEYNAALLAAQGRRPDNLSATSDTAA